VTPAIADASLIDGPARTVVLVIGGLACGAFAVAWLLCRAAAAGDRVEPGCDERVWLVDYLRTIPPPDQLAWLDYCDRCDGRHVFTRQAGVWRCLICDEPQRATEVYDNVAIEALLADLAAFERGER